MDKYFTYILESEVDGSFYYGYTSNLEKRLAEHNLGKSRYSAGKTPWKLIYYEEFNSKSEAIKREKELKRKKSKDYIEKYILEKTNSGGRPEWNSGSPVDSANAKTL